MSKPAKPKTKLAHYSKSSIRMVVPLMALSIATGLVLVVSSFAAGVYPSSYVNNLYNQGLGRNPDPSAVSYWKGQFSANGCNGAMLGTVSKSVYNSSEFAQRSLSNGEVVNRIYGGALRRSPDSGGYNYWVGRLNGGSSRGTVATGIINGSSAELNRLATSACVAPVSNPAPTPTPTPAPKPKPKPTATKPPTSTPAAAPAATGDKQAPSKPGKFTAKVDDASTGASLSWEAATDNVGVAVYKLQRSTNNTDWSTLSDSITGTSYEDRTVVFKTTYQYRVQAIDAAGNTGEFATTSVTTGEFNANTQAEDASTISSDDNIVVASIPAGTVPKDASCTITTDDDNTTELAGISLKNKVLVGPYLVGCKDDNGDQLADFQKSVAVTIAPPSKTTKGYAKFKVYVYDLQEQIWKEAASTYNKKSKTYVTTIEGPAQVALVGQKAANYWPLFLSIFIPVALIGGLAFWYYQRKMQKQQYADYIKKKYYNL